MIFPLCKWCFDINWHKFEKRLADVFQIYPNAIHLNPLQFCSSVPLLGFPVFCLSSSIVLNRYFHILVNSMTIWPVLKLPKIAWPSPFSKIIIQSNPNVAFVPSRYIGDMLAWLHQAIASEKELLHSLLRNSSSCMSNTLLSSSSR